MGEFGEGVRGIFLAGIGALAMTADKSKELVDSLIEKGELTVDQGRELNQELKHKVETMADEKRTEHLYDQISDMPPEDRAALLVRLNALQDEPAPAAPENDIE